MSTERNEIDCKTSMVLLFNGHWIEVVKQQAKRMLRGLFKETKM